MVFSKRSTGKMMEKNWTQMQFKWNLSFNIEVQSIFFGSFYSVPLPISIVIKCDNYVIYKWKNKINYQLGEKELCMAKRQWMIDTTRSSSNHTFFFIFGRLNSIRKHTVIVAGPHLFLLIHFYRSNGNFHFNIIIFCLSDSVFKHIFIWL